MNRQTRYSLVAVIAAAVFVGFIHPAPLSPVGALLLLVTGVFATLWFFSKEEAP